MGPQGLQGPKGDEAPSRSGCRESLNN
jgi:hypothetical protein